MTTMVPSLRNVLFVDDDALVGRAAQRIGARSGWNVLVAESGDQARRILNDTEVSVIVSDHRMPGEDGVALLADVRERWPHLERILMTGQVGDEVLEQAINIAGIACFVRKPWSRTVLIRTIEEAIERHELRRMNKQLVQRLGETNTRLQQANTRLSDMWETAFNAISEPTTIIDRDFRVRNANRAAVQLSGTADLRGRKCHEALFGETEVCGACPLAQGWTGSIDLAVGSSEKSFEAHGYEIPDSGTFLCIYHDVTEELRFRRHVAQVDKMAAMGRLASSMAHELNNPLHTIVAFAQIGRKAGSRPEKINRALEVIEKSATRCSSIIDSVRSYARAPQMRQRVRFDLIHLCREIIEIYRALDPRVIELASEESEVSARGNKNQIQQVIMNLVQNAFDASPDDARIRLRVTRSGAGPSVHVEDEGPGVPPSHRDRIFEPFHTTKPEGVGTGLGLAICHTIVAEHEGSLTVGDSADLGGAEFILQLPGGE